MRSENEGEESTSPERYYEIPTHISHKSEKIWAQERNNYVYMYIYLSEIT